MLPLLPFFSVWPYTPTIPAFYWNAKSQEEIIKHISCEIDKLIHYCDMLADNGNETRQAVNQLAEIFKKFQESGFDDYYRQQIEQWVCDNMRSIISQAIQMVYFGLTDDGYFVAYIPESWSQIMFDTEVNYASDNYGRLILSFNVEPLNN